MTATEQKRQHLLAFIQQTLVLETAVQGVVGIGSIATGLARPDSDIDAVVFFDAVDPYIVPAESIWRPSDGTFHSIFSNADWTNKEGIQLDFARFDLKQWADPGFEWPEGRRAELAEGWIALDRDGVVASLIAQRTAYREDMRLTRLDEAITWLDQHLGWDDPRAKWDSLGPAVAHDRLNAAYGYLAEALFAYNRRWRPWRNREMSYLLRLPWLPDQFDAHVLAAAITPSADYGGYLARYKMLKALFADLLAQLRADGDYGQDPIGEAFIRGAEEPGRAWNMDDWNARHRQRKLRSTQ